MGCGQVPSAVGSPSARSPQAKGGQFGISPTQEGLRNRPNFYISELSDMIRTLSNSASEINDSCFGRRRRVEVRVTGPHVIADGTSVVAGSAQGLLGHHLSALQWEASSPAGARPLLWMWQLAAQPACKTTTTGRTSSPTPSLPQ